MLKMIDLFSGIGGFSLAGRWAGFETISFVEKDVFCQKVLAKNFPDVPIYNDVKTFHFDGKVDLITGGFPCQPFSVAGKKKGFEDDRYLWPAFFRIIQQSKPAWIVAENVPGIVPALDPILEDLEREGYTWQAYLIPASAIGAPHKRERLWIVAHSSRKRCDDGGNNWKERYLQDDWERYGQTLQSKWSQFIPKSWKAFNAQDWLESTTDADCNQCHQGTADNDSIAERSEWSKFAAEIVSYDSIFNWQEDQPPVPGVDDGLPNGLDRNKALGNAIVPQVVYPILACIAEIEKK